MPRIKLIQTTYVAGRGTIDAYPDDPYELDTTPEEAKRLLREGYAVLADDSDEPVERSEVVKRTPPKSHKRQAKKRATRKKAAK